MPQARVPSTGVAEKLALLRNHSLFGELAATLLRELGRYATTRRTRRGTVIFAKGDPGTSLIAILSGSVKIMAPSPDGGEAILNVIHEGEFFGEIALLDGRPRTADAVAMTDCELIVIDRRDFVPFVRSHPEVALKLIEVLCARLRWSSEHFEEVMFLDPPGRLARTLLRLTDRAASAADGGRRVAITQRELSQMVGTSRENANKQLRAWAKRRWVKLERGRIVVLSRRALGILARSGFESDPS